MRRLSTRLVHSSASRGALPALSADESAAAKGSFLGSLFGGSSGPSQPPMTEPLAGLQVPPYTPPTAPATCQQKKLANGAILAAEDTPGSSVALGLYVESGSKYETALSAGAAQVLERLAFKATQNRSAFRLTREVCGCPAAAAPPQSRAGGGARAPRGDPLAHQP